MKKKMFIFFLVLMAIIYVLILKFQGFRLDLLYTANLTYVLMAFLTLFLILAVRSLKYWILLRAAKINAGIEAFPTTTLGFYANFISPIRISELVRSFIIKEKTKKSFFKILPPTIMDSLIDTSAMVFVIMVLSLFTTLSIDYLSKLVIIGIFAIIVFSLFFMISTKRGERIMIKLVKLFSSRFLKGKAEMKSAQFIKNLRDLLHKPKLIITIFAMACFIWFLEGLKLYFIVLASGVGLSILLTTLIISIAYLIGGSFVNPSGITQETVLLLLLLQLPFAKNNMLLAGSLDVIITVGTILVLGTIFLLRFGVKVLKAQT
jgi:uncharacterized protein (TIRG00374 family)